MGGDLFSHQAEHKEAQCLPEAAAAEGDPAVIHRISTKKQQKADETIRFSSASFLVLKIMIVLFSLYFSILVDSKIMLFFLQ